MCIAFQSIGSCTNNAFDDDHIANFFSESKRTLDISSCDTTCTLCRWVAEKTTTGTQLRLLQETEKSQQRTIATLAKSKQCANQKSIASTAKCELHMHAWQQHDQGGVDMLMCEAIITGESSLE